MIKKNCYKFKKILNNLSNSELKLFIFNSNALTGPFVQYNSTKINLNIGDRKYFKVRHYCSKYYILNIIFK